MLNSVKVKSALKKVRWFYSINAWLKSKSLQSEYQRTIRYYSEKNSVGTFESLLSDRLRNRTEKLKDSREQIRIFFVGTDEQQDRSGIVQALSKLGKLEYFTRADGGYGQNYQGSVAVRIRTNAERLLESFSNFEQEKKIPDLLIAQTWGSYIDPKALGHVRQAYGTIIVNIGMDDRHLYWRGKVNGESGGTYSLIPYIDLALTAAPECVEWYLKEGCPAVFFPEASDPNLFHPMPENPKMHDVCFVGGRYGIREKIVNTLRRAGISVIAYGSGWEKGRLPTEDVPKLFAQSKIVLGVGTVGHCDNFYALKMRDFDGPLSGSCYITHDNPDLYQLYEVGKEILTYRDVEECLRKVTYYLANNEKREKIAKAGYMRAIKEHTWDKRFQDLMILLRHQG